MVADGLAASEILNFKKRKPPAGFGAGERALLSIATAIGV
jgi:hypothetical protein